VPHISASPQITDRRFGHRAYDEEGVGCALALLSFAGGLLPEYEQCGNSRVPHPYRVLGSRNLPCTQAVRVGILTSSAMVGALKEQDGRFSAQARLGPGRARLQSCR